MKVMAEAVRIQSNGFERCGYQVFDDYILIIDCWAVDILSNLAK